MAHNLLTHLAYRYLLKSLICFKEKDAMSLTTIDHDKDYERLNDAIMKAIISSGDVKKVLISFQEKNLIDKMAVLNLILSLEEIESMMHIEPITK